MGGSIGCFHSFLEERPGWRGSMEVGESDVPNPIESNAVVTDIGQRIFDQAREEVSRSN